MSTDKLFKMQQKALYDKEQSVLTFTGCLPNPRNYAKKEIRIKYEEKVLCPFCLNWEIFGHYKVKGNLAECPKCKNKMLIKTVYNIKKMTIEQFARWVFEYRLSGFFDKINFKEWTQKLYLSGDSFDFWNEYKRLKGEGILTEQEKTVRNVK